MKSELIVREEIEFKINLKKKGKSYLSFEHNPKAILNERDFGFKVKVRLFLLTRLPY